MTVVQVLRTLLTAVPIDRVSTMGIPADDPDAHKGEPPVWLELRKVLKGSPRPACARTDFEMGFLQGVESPDHVLTIQTGDQALWANVLLTLSCRTK